MGEIEAALAYMTPPTAPLYDGLWLTTLGRQIRRTGQGSSILAWLLRNEPYYRRQASQWLMLRAIAYLSLLMEPAPIVWVAA